MIKFYLRKLGVRANVKVKKGKFKHYAEVYPTKNGYTLKINCPEELIPQVVAHECAHIKQYEVDGLCLLDEGGMFRGEYYKGSYWWAPWEIEARGLEEALLHEREKCTQKQKQKHLKSILKHL